jgi:hypothetical protein
MKKQTPRRNLRDNLLKAFNSRLGHYLVANSEWMMAAFLNPNYKDAFGGQLDCTTETYVQAAATDLRAKRQPREVPVQPPQEEDPMMSYLFRVKKQPSVQAVEVDIVAAQLALYKSYRITNHTDPLKFWHNNREQLPDLYELAKTLFVVQATSIECERAFSSAGNIFTQKRNRLNVNILEDIFVCHMHLRQRKRSQPEDN